MQGSFDYAAASLREAAAPLRMAFFLWGLRHAPTRRSAFRNKT